MGNAEDLGRSVPTTITLPAPVRRAAEQLAAADGRSLSNFLSRLIEAGVARRAARATRRDVAAPAGRVEHAVPAA
jgi:hypothetical protein